MSNLGLTDAIMYALSKDYRQGRAAQQQEQDAFNREEALIRLKSQIETERELARESRQQESQRRQIEADDKALQAIRAAKTGKPMGMNVGSEAMNALTPGMDLPSGGFNQTTPFVPLSADLRVNLSPKVSEEYGRIGRITEERQNLLNKLDSVKTDVPRLQTGGAAPTLPPPGGAAPTLPSPGGVAPTPASSSVYLDNEFGNFKRDNDQLFRQQANIFKLPTNELNRLSLDDLRELSTELEEAEKNKQAREQDYIERRYQAQSDVNKDLAIARGKQAIELENKDYDRIQALIKESQGEKSSNRALEMYLESIYGALGRDENNSVVPFVEILEEFVDKTVINPDYVLSDEDALSVLSPTAQKLIGSTVFITPVSKSRADGGYLSTVAELIVAAGKLGLDFQDVYQFADKLDGGLQSAKQMLGLKQLKGEDDTSIGPITENEWPKLSSLVDAARLTEDPADWVRGVVRSLASWEKTRIETNKRYAQKYGELYTELGNSKERANRLSKFENYINTHPNKEQILKDLQEAGSAIRMNRNNEVEYGLPEYIADQRELIVDDPDSVAWKNIIINPQTLDDYLGFGGGQ